MPNFNAISLKTKNLHTIDFTLFYPLRGSFCKILFLSKAYYYKTYSDTKFQNCNYINKQLLILGINPYCIPRTAPQAKIFLNLLLLLHELLKYQISKL